MLCETEEDIRRQLKIKKVDNLLHECKEEIKVIFHKSIDLLISSIVNSNNNNNNNNNKICNYNSLKV